MDMEKVKDIGATGVGGGLGLDQIYTAINALMVDGATGEEWLALSKGILLIVFGFFSWRRAS